MADNWRSTSSGIGFSIGIVGIYRGTVTDLTNGTVREYRSYSFGTPTEFDVGYERSFSVGTPETGWSVPTFNIGFSAIFGLSVSVNIDDPNNESNNSATLTAGSDVGFKFGFTFTKFTRVIGVDVSIAKKFDTPSESNAITREIDRLLSTPKPALPSTVVDPQQRAEMAQQNPTPTPTTPTGTLDPQQRQELKRQDQTPQPGQPVAPTAQPANPAQDQTLCRMSKRSRGRKSEGIDRFRVIPRRSAWRGRPEMRLGLAKRPKPRQSK